MPEPATSDETSLPDGRGSTPASELVHVSIPVKAMCDAAPGAARPPGPPVSGSLRARRSTLLQHRQRRLPTHTPMGATLHEPARTTACHPPAAMPRTDRVSRPLTLIEARGRHRQRRYPDPAYRRAGAAIYLGCCCQLGRHRLTRAVDARADMPLGVPGAGGDLPTVYDRSATAGTLLALSSLQPQRSCALSSVRGAELRDSAPGRNQIVGWQVCESSHCGRRSATERIRSLVASSASAGLSARSYPVLGASALRERDLASAEARRWCARFRAVAGFAPCSP
jgi:hypothetical protein